MKKNPLICNNSQKGPRTNVSESPEEGLSGRISGHLDGQTSSDHISGYCLPQGLWAFRNGAVMG